MKVLFYDALHVWHLCPFDRKKGALHPHSHKTLLISSHVTQATLLRTTGAQIRSCCQNLKRDPVNWHVSKWLICSAERLSPSWIMYQGLLSYQVFPGHLTQRGLGIMEMRDFSHQLWEVMGGQGRGLSHPGVTIRLINEIYVCAFMLLYRIYKYHSKCLRWRLFGYW